MAMREFIRKIQEDMIATTIAKSIIAQGPPAGARTAPPKAPAEGVELGV